MGLCRLASVSSTSPVAMSMSLPPPRGCQVLDLLVAREQGLAIFADPCEVPELVWTCFPPQVRQVFLRSSRWAVGYCRPARGLLCWLQGGHHVLWHLARLGCGQRGGEGLWHRRLQDESRAEVSIWSKACSAG